MSFQEDRMGPGICFVPKTTFQLVDDFHQFKIDRLFVTICARLCENTSNGQSKSSQVWLVWRFSCKIGWVLVDVFLSNYRSQSFEKLHEPENTMKLNLPAMKISILLLNRDQSILIISDGNLCIPGKVQDPLSCSGRDFEKRPKLVC